VKSIVRAILSNQAIRKKIFRLIRYAPNRSVSVYRGNNRSKIDSRFVEVYSDSAHVDLWDPRLNERVGHHFLRRHVCEVSNVIADTTSRLYTQNGLYIDESYSFHPYITQFEHPFLIGHKISDKKKYQGHFILLQSTGLFHWLIEDLPPFLHLRKLFPDATIAVDDSAPTYVTDLLDYMGGEVLRVKSPCQFEKVSFVTRRNDSGWQHPKDLKIVRTFFKVDDSTIQHASHGKKIFVSRDGSRRNVANDSDVENIFRLRGFDIIKLEDFSLFERLEIFRDVKVMAGLHGSNQAAMVWMRPGSMILDIANIDFYHETTPKLSQMLNQKYECFLYDGVVDGNIDLVSLRSWLNKVDK
jgi:hypothetical protein